VCVVYVGRRQHSKYIFQSVDIEDISYENLLHELQHDDFYLYAENAKCTEYKEARYKPIQQNTEMPEGNGSFLNQERMPSSQSMTAKAKSTRTDGVVGKYYIFTLSMTYEICEKLHFSILYLCNGVTQH
jgi:hypothetical protein